MTEVIEKFEPQRNGERLREADLDRQSKIYPKLRLREAQWKSLPPTNKLADGGNFDCQDGECDRRFREIGNRAGKKECPNPNPTLPLSVRVLVWVRA